MPLLHPAAIIDPLPTKMVLVIGVERGITAVASVVRVAGCIVQPSIRRRIVITEVEMVALRSHEQVQHERFIANPTGGMISVTGAAENRRSEIDRSKQMATSGQRIVPISGHINATTRSPIPTRCHPRPSVSVTTPGSRLPLIGAGVPYPVSGCPEIIV